MNISRRSATASLTAVALGVAGLATGTAAVLSNAQPLLILLPAWFLYGEKPSRRVVLAMLVGFTGLMIVAVPGGGGTGAMLALTAALAVTVGTLLVILLCFNWVSLVGVVRAEFLRGRNFDYVRAARALGMLDVRIMMRHILPNAMTASLTFLPFILAGSVTTLTSLDFLGYGLPPGSPSLGELLLQGKNNLNAPWLAFTAFFTIALMLSLLVFIGEAVRDSFNPRKAPA